MSDQEQEYTQTTGSSTATGWRRWFHFGWIRTPIGILKVAEFVVLVLGLIIMASVSYTGSISAIEFFIFVCTTAWIFVLTAIILHILNIYQRLPAIVISNLVMLVCCGLGALMLMICSSVVIGKYNWHSKVVAAGSFGLIAMFFFIFEAVYYFIQFRQNGSIPNSHTTTTTTTQEFSETAVEY